MSPDPEPGKAENLGKGEGRGGHWGSSVEKGQEGAQLWFERSLAILLAWTF